MIGKRLLLVAACMLTAWWSFPARASAQAVEAVTKPSKDVTLSFVRPGKIDKITVLEGQSVKAGEVLVQLDDAAEKANLSQLKAQAEDTIRVKAAEAQLSQKQVDLEKLDRAAKQGAATELEVQHAKLDVLIAELSRDLAKFEHDQDARKYEESKILVERMRLLSPFDGKVEQILVEAGESVDTMTKVIRVVHVDPLWVDVAAPLKQAENLKVGDIARIIYGPVRPDDKGVGKIIHIGSVADAASDTVRVRLEAPNPSQRPAGERVSVILNVDGAAAPSEDKSTTTQPRSK